MRRSRFPEDSLGRCPVAMPVAPSPGALVPDAVVPNGQPKEQTVNEYQKFVADKAQVLVELMEQIGQKDREVAKLLGVMRPSLDSIIRRMQPLPGSLGWWHYFSPDGPDGIYEAYPALVDAYCALSWVLRYDRMESYLQARKDLSK